MSDLDSLIAFMHNDVVEVVIKGVAPTADGCAVFLTCPEKTFVIYVDQPIGQSLMLAVNKVRKERPLTHDLIRSMFIGLGVKLLHIIINDVQEGTFFARIFLMLENELGKKLVEVDARPSDSMVLAVQFERPMYVSRSVLNAVEDMSGIFERISKFRSEMEDRKDGGLRNKKADRGDDFISGGSFQEDSDEEEGENDLH